MTNTEHAEKKILIQWFRIQYPRWHKCLWAVPNGGMRHVRTAIKLKEEGLLAGVADLFLMIPKNNKHGMFIEMKAKKGKLQENQKDFLKIAQSMGYETKVCFGFNDAKNTIINYLQN